MKQSSLPTSANCATRAPSINGTTTNLIRVDVTSEENITHSLNKFKDIERWGITEVESRSSDQFPIVYDGSRYKVRYDR